MLKAYIFILSAILFAPLNAEITCSDEETECQDDQTCCQLSTGEWGCCPLPAAVCCSDGEHCCPEGTTCNLPKSTCDKASGSIKWFTKVIGRVVKNDILCPDGVKKCDAENTCCKIGNPPTWGCCMFAHAVCCDDHSHCCPHGSTCNGSTCIKRMQRQPAHPLFHSKKSKCDNGQFQCKGQAICCKTPTGEFSCCPLQNAICCSDGRHCCPSNTTCDSRTGRCASTNTLVQAQKWTNRYAAILKDPVVCPGGQFKCPSDTTCCLLTTGRYGCCPDKEAVCCEDKIHCCPHGTQCDLTQQRCLSSRGVKNLLTKLPALQVDDITCPDTVSKCPDGTTCCQTASNRFGCCPLPRAVCCSDKLHCCPTGTTCDVQQGTCLSGSTRRTPWFTKFEATRN